jgi:hypothetical protein
MNDKLSFSFLASPSSSPSSSEQQTEPPSVPTKPENTPGMHVHYC